MIYKIIKKLKNTKCFYDTKNDKFVSEKDSNISNSFYKSSEKMIEDFKKIDKILKEYLKQINKISQLKK